MQAAQSRALQQGRLKLAEESLLEKRKRRKQEEIKNVVDVGRAGLGLASDVVGGVNDSVDRMLDRAKCFQVDYAA